VVKPQYFPCETGDDRAARSSVGLEPTDLADSRIPYNKKRAEDYPPPKRKNSMLLVDYIVLIKIYRLIC